MKRITAKQAGACIVGGAIAGLAILHLYAQPVPLSGNIEDRRYFWNGYWGDRAKGEDVFKGEVHGWMLPEALAPIPPENVDPYPSGMLNEEYHPTTFPATLKLRQPK